MGQVWQATDTQLNREVALKILPDAFAADPDRLARFTREAQILASLNHPNIAAIYGIEEAEGTRALVLELVEGPTLADRIKQGTIPACRRRRRHRGAHPLRGRHRHHQRAVGWQRRSIEPGRHRGPRRRAAAHPRFGGDGSGDRRSAGRRRHPGARSDDRGVFPDPVGHADHRRRRRLEHWLRRCLERRLQTVLRPIFRASIAGFPYRWMQRRSNAAGLPPRTASGSLACPLPPRRARQTECLPCRCCPRGRRTRTGRPGFETWAPWQSRAGSTSWGRSR